ncbi:MAG TPA: SPOR domain-containing protein [Steroidobacteraceae bacterium]|jgi:cell division protein FtsN|nr:SPOR domain-containing protein [Steroidobacteraceae bacterium]
MAGGGVNRMTTRDFKKTSRRPMNLGRLREFGGGLLVGVVLASGLFIYKSDAKKAVPESPRPEPQRTAVAERDTAAASNETGDKYDFYEMLPNFEVVVPEKDREVKRDLPAGRIDRPGVYVLQAGSYRNQADADRVRAQLSLQGIDAKVQRVAVDSDVWHRVRIGPINDLGELNRVRRQLQAAEVDGLVIRVGD